MIQYLHLLAVLDDAPRLHSFLANAKALNLLEAVDYRLRDWHICQTSDSEGILDRFYNNVTPNRFVSFAVFQMRKRRRNPWKKFP